jgi:hypothetical protein
VSTVKLQIYIDNILVDFKKYWVDHTKDGDGIILIDDKIKVFPHEPKAYILNALAALDAIEHVDHPTRSKVALGITEAIREIVKDWSGKFTQ